MKNTWNILSIVSIVLAVALTLLCIFKGSCGGMIECTSGNVPMKCHWAYRASALIAGASALISIIGIAQKTKESRRMVAISSIVLDVLILLVLFAIIGVCAKAEMACHVNRLIVSAVAIVDIVVMLIGLAKADPELASRPKAKF